MDHVHIGDIVQTAYKSGAYIGKFLEDRGNFYLIEVLAVLKHPKQGDLHHPGKVDNVAFFERKALAYREKMNARKRTTQPYDGEVPSYHTSLKEAVDQLKAQLTTKDTLYNQKALEKLHDLEKHYYHKIYE